MLSHNLTLLFELVTQCAEEIGNEVETRGKHRRQRTLKNREGHPYQQANNYINQVFQRATQRTFRFLRWLRTRLYQEAPWSKALARLTHIWTC
ncbi:hypothetical protein JIN85_01135 [Luteolibacter pohnpeiensis]|uniref:Uncharacterized protein n=1 Tax=Luteolibacter pohnpeiensis TaxID=454153 RepID=A0A934S590_9BACT|nr:hypothetical protein [Luteolibacter pohnpeiensis]MBK1880996.1 hypothetical protein [Luteolibacter pohnpeiensis]